MGHEVPALVRLAVTLLFCFEIACHSKNSFYVCDADNFAFFSYVEVRMYVHTSTYELMYGMYLGTSSIFTMKELREANGLCMAYSPNVQRCIFFQEI